MIKNFLIINQVLVFKTSGSVNMKLNYRGGSQSNTVWNNS